MNKYINLEKSLTRESSIFIISKYFPVYVKHDQVGNYCLMSGPSRDSQAPSCAQNAYALIQPTILSRLMCISGLRSLNSFTPFTLLLKVDGTGPKKKKYRNTLTNVSPLSVRLSTSLTFASYITRSSSCLRTAALYHFILPLLFKFLPCSDGASTHTHTDQNV